MYSNTPLASLFDLASMENVSSGSAYNLTMSSINTMLTFPSRLIARMRKIDDLLSQEAERQAAYTTDARIHRMRAGDGPPLGPALPGPWAFMTSGYAVGLFAMALLLNRIQNIVVPPRQPSTHRRALSQSWMYRMRARLFPLNLSSLYTRTILRLPTLFYLLKSLTLWTIILWQTTGYFPSWSFLGPIDSWGRNADVQDVCWLTFVAVCASICVSSITRGLEGQNLENASTFNLFGYAFMLQIYSSPITQVDGSKPPRPDKHAIVTLLVPLLQLTMLHFLSIRRTWSKQRLIPTSICSLISLAHFHYVTWLSSSPYPLLNYVPCVLESILLVIILLTISLNALTQLLVEGEVARPLFGHAATLKPKRDEEFSIALLRIGTASLEATSVVGFGNEVGRVVQGADLALPMGEQKAEGTVEISRWGVSSVTPGQAMKGHRRKRGLANEIKQVKATTYETELWMDTAWYREVTRFLLSIGHAARGTWRIIWSFIRRRPITATQPSVTNITPMPLRLRSLDDSQEEQGDYERFLRGDPVSDDEEEWHSTGASRSASLSATPDLTDEDGDVEYSEIPETAALYTDHAGASASASAVTAPLMLAHMTDAATTPLTRRRYRNLMAASHSTQTATGEDAWTGLVEERRRAQQAKHSADEETMTESRRNCVICTVEPRDIICWPCRCLALCDDCRENLSSRSSAARHLCPCCRRAVEGYSRIYIP